jgi:solute carrier family 45 protein 1/2/4
MQQVPNRQARSSAPQSTTQIKPFYPRALVQVCVEFTIFRRVLVRAHRLDRVRCSTDTGPKQEKEMGFGPLVQDEKTEYHALLGEEKQKKVSLMTMALATICFAGVQFGWALQISQLTPFVQELGLSPLLSSIVWLCGPVAGLLVQPIVGVWSDACTARLGRRRPFIITGAALIVLALILIPSSPDLGRLIGSNGSSIGFAILGFWILDLSNNTLQGPCRALIADIVPSHQQASANGMFSFWLGFGNVSGYLAGFVDWSRYFAFLETAACTQECTSLRVAFLYSVILLVVTTALTCLFTREVPLAKPENNDSGVLKQISNIFPPIFRAIVRMPAPMIRIVLVQFFSWFGWFCFLIYITDWVGTAVYGGSSTAPKNSDAYNLYVEGVRWGSFSLAGYAVVSTLASIVTPLCAGWLGAKIVWAFGSAVLSVCLILTAFVKERYLAFALISTFGIPWAVTMVIPFALTGIVAPSAEKGLFMGVLNIFVVLPQLLVSLLAIGVLRLFKGNVISMLVTGGIVSAFAIPLCFFLIIKKVEHPENVEAAKE